MRWTGLVAVLFLLPACASASVLSGDPSREGMYVSAAGISGLEFFQPGHPLGGESDAGLGGALRVGYRGDEGTAVEVFAEDARGYRLNSSTGRDPRLEIRSMGVAGKVFLSEGNVQPYALVGGGWAFAMFSSNEASAPLAGVRMDKPYSGANDSSFVRGGLGCEFHFNERFGAFVEANYNHMLRRLQDYDHLDGVLGIVIRF